MSSDIVVNNDWEIQIECFPKLNFALQQSSGPFIRHLSVHNNTDENRDNIRLKISATPEFIAPKVTHNCDDCGEFFVGTRWMRKFLA